MAYKIRLLPALIFERKLAMAEGDHVLTEFEQGVVYAAGLIVRLHDQPGMAAEFLREAGLDRHNFSDCDDFEKESLRKLQGERNLRLYGL